MCKAVCGVAKMPSHFYDELLASGRFAQQISCRNDCGKYDENWFLEDKSQLRGTTSRRPLLDKCSVASGNVATVTQTLAIYYCRQNYKWIMQRVQERNEAMLKQFE